MKSRAVTFVLVSLCVLGCGKADDSTTAMVTATEGMGVADSSGSMAVADAAMPMPTKAGVEWKIVYTADVEIVVEEFDDVPSQVKDLTEQHGGYLAKSNIRGRPGSPRSGAWTIRVPLANYEVFLAAARELGETRSVRTDSDDVTAEFYDVEARIRNKKHEEDRLLEHLKASTGKLDDILNVEREISRVRSEIERIEGRMRMLKDLTSLTTITLQVDEIKDYVPEGDATKAVSVAIVAAVPWLGVLLVVLVMGFALRLLNRMLFRRAK